MSHFDNPQQNLDGGRKTVTTAGTPVALVTTVVPTSWVIIQAETDNTGKIAVGTTGVVAAAGSQSTGIILSAGESITLPLSDLRQIKLDSTVNGDGVTYLYGW